MRFLSFTRAGLVLAGACLALAAGAARAELLNSTKVVLTIAGSEVLNVHGGGPNAPAQAQGSRSQGGVAATMSASANQFGAARVQLSGSNSANGTAAGGSAWSFTLVAPPGANLKGGKVVLHGRLVGTVSGTANAHMTASLQLDGGYNDGSAAVTLSGPNETTAMFDVSSDIATFVPAGDLKGRVRISVEATATLPAGGGSALAEGTSESRIIGFSVYDSSGKQVTGFTMNADGGAIPESGGSAPGGTTTAVEYFHQEFGHYFVTSIAAEISALDSGKIVGWSRTGESFKVNTAAASGEVGVCRFFTVAFPPSSSHFYGPRGLGCEDTMKLPAWQYEGDVFFVALSTDAGLCPTGMVPVYRLYNNGKGGAPNHRFTTSTATRQTMINQGWTPEGRGQGVGFCVPA